MSQSLVFNSETPKAFTLQVQKSFPSVSVPKKCCSCLEGGYYFTMAFLNAGSFIRACQMDLFSNQEVRGYEKMERALQGTYAVSFISRFTYWCHRVNIFVLSKISRIALIAIATAFEIPYFLCELYIRAKRICQLTCCAEKEAKESYPKDTTSKVYEIVDNAFQFMEGLFFALSSTTELVSLFISATALPILTDVFLLIGIVALVTRIVMYYFPKISNWVVNQLSKGYSHCN